MLGNKELGSPKVTFGHPNSLASFCINVEGVERERDFFPVRMKRDVVRRTISLCNKELWFSCWRKMGEISKCYAVDGGKMNYFVFHALSINREIVLTLRTDVLI